MKPHQHGRFFADWWPVVNCENDFLMDADARRSKSFTGIPGVRLQDSAVIWSMGSIMNRPNEHLGTADAAIIRVRRRLLEGDQGAARPRHGAAWRGGRRAVHGALVSDGAAAGSELAGGAGRLARRARRWSTPTRASWAAVGCWSRRSATTTRVTPARPRPALPNTSWSGLEEAAQGWRERVRVEVVGLTVENEHFSVAQDTGQTLSRT